MARKRNQKPSFVADTLDTFVPTGFMERTAKGIAGDLSRVKGKIMGRRNPDVESLGARRGLAAVVPGGMVALTALDVAEALNKGMIDEATGVLVKPMEEVAEVFENPKGEKWGVYNDHSRYGSRLQKTFSSHDAAKRYADKLNDRAFSGKQSPSGFFAVRKMESNPRRNPEDTSALAYDIFHGKPPEGTTEILEEIHEHENLWALGALQEIVIEPVSMPGRQATFEFQSDNPWLCGNEPSETSGGLFEPSQMVCTQLYVRGGDQGLDLDGIKMGHGTKWYREHMCLGYLVELTYHTQKGFDSFKPVDYYHALGEETGEVPVVCYDTRNNLITIQGGQYEIKAEGICN